MLALVSVTLGLKGRPLIALVSVTLGLKEKTFATLVSVTLGLRGRTFASSGFYYSRLERENLCQLWFLLL